MKSLSGASLVLLHQNDDVIQDRYVHRIFLFKLLNNNQDLVLINMKGIDIYTINEDGLRHRYFWHNNEWNDIYEEFKKNDDDDSFIKDIQQYKQLIDNILKNEFDDSKHSIPLSKSMELLEENGEGIVEDFMSDSLILVKFGIEMLNTAIKHNHNDFIQQIINNIIESILDYPENYMHIISLNLLELCDYYPDFIIKYISCTSIILPLYCNGIKYSENASFQSYTKYISIKESKMDKKNFKSILLRLIRYSGVKMVEKKIQTVSFIVPFPQICIYNETENNSILKVITPKSNCIWNKFLYRPKSILFSNMDGDGFYNLWNFAAIIDFKWQTFGRFYYYLIWAFYTIFYVCYALASTLEQNSIPDIYFNLLFIISIIFGSVFLILETRQFLWDYKIYINDTWNILVGIPKRVFPFLVLLLFIVLGYAQGFFIVLRSNSINDDNDPRNVATKYDFVNPDETISNATTMIQDPDSNTNLFNWFPTSLLAVYKLLTGDSGSLSSFTYREHSLMTILMVSFTFSTVIYLMNLFIGLLTDEINVYKREEEFLLHKAKLIMEIELFYMTESQRLNNKEWFPDQIYYEMPVTKVRNLIEAIDKNQTTFNYPPIISKKLRKLVMPTNVLTNDNKKQDNEGEQNNNLKRK
ncbi:hypothetical protein RclHR1_14240005 [Rhizophagus clarus]|uniref:Ion transport domain-containing protein n=1 Tax=Rhizophagus clarus TaxID=94130 RepID=A0A2Z6R4P1_9GLOM|nr:hypothetical protein RclHR1_14240005 [Rhizophagus clarus]